MCHSRFDRIDPWTQFSRLQSATGMPIKKLRAMHAKTENWKANCASNWNSRAIRRILSTGVIALFFLLLRHIPSMSCCHLSAFVGTTRWRMWKRCCTARKRRSPREKKGEPGRLDSGRTASSRVKAHTVYFQAESAHGGGIAI